MGGVKAGEVAVGRSLIPPFAWFGVGIPGWVLMTWEGNIYELVRRTWLLGSQNGTETFGGPRDSTMTSPTCAVHGGEAGGPLVPFAGTFICMSPGVPESGHPIKCLAGGRCETFRLGGRLIPDLERPTKVGRSEAPSSSLGASRRTRQLLMSTGFSSTT